MTRTLLIKNVFNKCRYYNGEVITVLDLLTNDVIHLRACSDRIYKFRGINDELIIITAQPWQKMRVSNSKSEPKELVFHNICRAGIGRRTEVKNKFPEYFI